MIQVSYFKKFKDAFVGKTPQRYYARIESDHVSPPEEEAPFEPDGNYLSIWLNDMYLEHRRVLYKKMVPIVHAFYKVGKSEAIPVIVGASQLKELSTNQLEKVIKLNYRIFGPTPFEGGDVEMFVGLFAVETADYGNRFLDLLGSLSTLAGAGEIGAAVQIMKPLKDGIEGLFGLNKTQCHIGVHDTFSLDKGAPSPLRSGYRVVIDTSEDEMKGKELWVTNGRLMCGDSRDSAKTFTDADYILFKIQSLRERGDFMLLNSINEAWDAAIQESSKPGERNHIGALVTFWKIVLRSKDLILSDKIRLLDALKKKLEDLKKTLEEVGKKPPVIKVVMFPQQRYEEIEADIKTSLSKAISIEEAKSKTVKDVSKTLLMM